MKLMEYKKMPKRTDVLPVVEFHVESLKVLNFLIVPGRQKKGGEEGEENKF